MKASLAAVALAAAVATTPAAPSAWAQSARTGPTGLNAQDHAFLKEAGNGNQAEVELGNLAAQKATRPEVRMFGRWMASAHGDANRQLGTLAEQLYHTAPPTTLTPEAQAELRKLQGLSGPEFDQQYLQIMAQDHEKDVAAFRREAQGGQDIFMKTFAQNMLPALDEHMAAIQDLTKSSR